jgi:MATE family multidrug resistance protein
MEFSGPPHNAGAPSSGQTRGELASLLTLAAPVSAGMLGGLFMQIVDTMFVGRLGPSAIGGVAIGNSMFATLMIVGLGLTAGLDYLISHAFGSRKLSLGNEYLVQALYLVVTLSLVLGALMWVAGDTFQYFGLEPEVATLACVYLRTLAWSLLPFLLFMVFRQYLQAQGIAVPALVIMVVANAVNALGNWTFVFGHLGMPALGVMGAGLATFFSRIFMLAAIVVYTFWRDRKLALGLPRTQRALDPAKLREIIRLGLPSALQMLFEVGVFATATFLAGRLGAVALAGHQIVLQMASFTFMFPLGVSSATAVRVGQALGAGQKARAVRVGWTALGFGASFAVVMGLTMFLFSRTLMRGFTADEQVIATGSGLLLIAALFQVSDAMQVIGTGALRGIGETKIPMYSNLFGHWAVGLPTGAALCFSLGWGVRGLWIGLSIGLTAVAAALVLAWWRKSRHLSVVAI